MTAAASLATVDVGIVTYNSGAHIEATVRSVLQHPEIRCVTIVDNCSTDNTRSILDELARTQRGRVSVVHGTRNEGFGRATNRALAASDAPFVLVLNPDTRLIEEGCVGRLLRHLEDPGVACVGCRLVREDGTDDRAALRRDPDLRSSLAYFFLRAPRLSRYVVPLEERARVVDAEAINGAFMLCRTTAFREAGGFHEKYWMYGEDLDLCRTLRALGHRVVYDGTVRCVHLKGASTGRWRVGRPNFEFHRAMVIYYLRFNDRSTRLLLPLVVLGALARYLLTEAIGRAGRWWRHAGAFTPAARQ